MEIHAETTTQFSNTTEVVYTVPAGQRLSIEFVTLSGTKEKSQTMAYLSVQTTLGGAQINHPIFRVTEGFSASGGFASSMLVRLYADENTDVTLRAVGDSGASLKAWGGTIVGRLDPVS